MAEPSGEIEVTLLRYQPLGSSEDSSSHSTYKYEFSFGRSRWFESSSLRWKPRVEIERLSKLGDGVEGNYFANCDLFSDQVAIQDECVLYFHNAHSVIDK